MATPASIYKTKVNSKLVKQPKTKATSCLESDLDNKWTQVLTGFSHAQSLAAGTYRHGRSRE